MCKKKVLILNDINSGSMLNDIDIKTEQRSEVIKDEYSLQVDVVVKKRGRKKRSKMYFTQETEDAIVLYNNEQDPTVRNEIYDTYIKYSIEKLAENIINTFKFSYIGEKYIDIKTDVVSKIILEMNKYDQSKGKAFSYFSIMAKNHLIISNNDAYKELKLITSISTPEDDDFSDLEILDEEYDNRIIDSETKEFICMFVEYWESNVSFVFKKDRDIDIANSVLELLRNVNSLEFFNKKALYLLIREMSGHKTQYITKVINKMASTYLCIKNSYLSYGNLNEDDIFIYKS